MRLLLVTLGVLLVAPPASADLVGVAMDGEGSSAECARDERETRVEEYEAGGETRRDERTSYRRACETREHEAGPNVTLRGERLVHVRAYEKLDTSSEGDAWANESVAANGSRRSTTEAWSRDASTSGQGLEVGTAAWTLRVVTAECANDQESATRGETSEPDTGSTRSSHATRTNACTSGADLGVARVRAGERCAHDLDSERVSGPDGSPRTTESRGATACSHGARVSALGRQVDAWQETSSCHVTGTDQTTSEGWTATERSVCDVGPQVGGVSVALRRDVASDHATACGGRCGTEDGSFLVVGAEGEEVLVPLPFDPREPPVPATPEPPGAPAILP